MKRGKYSHLFLQSPSLIVPAIRYLTQNHPFPLAISLAITNRCNSNCSYCARWKNPLPEMKTRTIIKIIRKLHSMGLRFMQITGGEPLLRKDLKTVLIEANRLNIYTGLNTNGLLLKDHKNILPLLHRLTISLDGPPEVHEKFRPAGTFDAAVEALAIAADSGVDAAMQATVTSANAKYINYMVELAAKLKVRMIFEPASEYLLGEYSSNSTCGERKIIKNAMKKVESLKRDNPHISNQTLELRYLQVWPDSHNLRCLGSKIFFRVDSNGDVMVCGQSPMHYARDGMSRSKMPNILREGLTQALSGVPEPPCDTCYCCSRLQMNLIYSALFNPWKTLTGPPSR